MKMCLLFCFLGFLVHVIAWSMVYPKILEVLKAKNIAIDELKYQNNARARSRYITQIFKDRAPDDDFKTKVLRIEALGKWSILGLAICIVSYLLASGIL